MMKSLSIAAAFLFGASQGGALNTRDWAHEWTLEQVNSMSDHEIEIMWGAWQSHFGHPYADHVEEAEKFAVWQDNLKKIAAINSQNHSFKLALNDFADMTDEEWRERYSCLSRGSDKSPYVANKMVTDDDGRIADGLPSSVDWEAAGVCTPVKNQGQCGSCWAFSATGSMECQYAIRTGTLNSLSEQELVDCSGSYGNYGCSGGWYYSAWQYAEKEGGLCLEADYPYTARDGTCKDSTCGTKYNDPKSYTRVTADSDTALATATAAGCVSVAIEADQTSFQYYSSGVLTGLCGTSIDHAVLVVGYGTNSQNQEYWKVKNSWGTSWGDKGYVYICRNCNKNGDKGECGINMYPYTVSE